MPTLDSDDPGGVRGGEPRRSSGAAIPGLLVVCALLAAVLALDPAANLATLTRLMGLPERAETVHRPGDPGGEHAFLLTVPGSGRPVGFDPCRPLEVLLNPAGAPDNHRELVTTGLTRIEAATGLDVRLLGTTGARDIVGDGRRSPALIMWADEDEVPELAGDVAGVGGALAVGSGGRERYVTGRVVLDVDYYDSLGWWEARWGQAVMDHELAHLVGLGHVEDGDELMVEGTGSRTRFGPGDLEGLAALGALPCSP